MSSFMPPEEAKSVSNELGTKVKEPVTTACKRPQKLSQKISPLTADQTTTLKTEVELKRFVPPAKYMGPTKRSFVHEFKEVFEGTGLEFKEKRIVKAKVEEPIPTVCKSPKELGKGKEIILRTADQTTKSEDVQLKQFDPNFFSHVNILCRFPGCEQRRSRQCKFNGSKTSKEDLYLCPGHRKDLGDDIARRCAKQGVDISNNWSSEDLKEYTSMIGFLESAFNSFSSSSTLLTSKHTVIKQEVCLNMRNYLIIVNALLNPLGENIMIALNATTMIFKLIQLILKDDEVDDLKNLKELIDLLKELIEYILSYFGIIYSWVHRPLYGNPAAQVGVGIGGIIGMAGFFGGIVLGVVTAAAGALFGGLIANGWYTLQGRQVHGEVHNERLRAYQQFAHFRHQGDVTVVGPIYYVTGNAEGDLSLAVIDRNMLSM